MRIFRFYSYYLLWDFFHQIIYTLQCRTRAKRSRFPLCALLSLFWRCSYCWMVRTGISALSCQFRLAHFGQCAQALRFVSGFCCAVQFVHLISKLANVHFMVGRIQHSHLGNRHSLLNFREAQPGIPLVICDSPARPVFETAVIRIGCLADGFWLPACSSTLRASSTPEVPAKIVLSPSSKRWEISLIKTSSILFPADTVNH